MTQEEIKTIFDNVFNGRSNPLFSVPITYFEKDNFVGEIAKAPDI